MNSDSFWPAALTIGAFIGMGVAVWLSRGGWKRFRRTDEPLSLRVDELTLEVVELRLLLSEVMVGTARLIAQLEQARIEPEYRLPSERKRWPAEGEESDVARLHRLLVEYFNNEELDSLALEAGIAPESYSGSTRPARALALVQVASRHDRLEELVRVARRERPRVKWPLGRKDER